MITRIVQQPVTVVRDGKHTLPQLGKPFQFTDMEVKEINGLNPSALAHVVVDEPEVRAEPMPAVATSVK